MTVEIIVQLYPMDLKMKLEERLGELSKSKIKPEIHFSIDGGGDSDSEYAVLLVY